LIAPDRERSLGGVKAARFLMVAVVVGVSAASASANAEPRDDASDEDVCDPVETECPETLPYSPERPIPPGYHKVSEMRWGLLLSGAAATAAGAAILVGCSHACVEHDDSWNKPLIMGFGFLTVLAGAPVLLAGLFARNEYLQLNAPATTAWRLPVDVGVALDPTRGAGSLTLVRAF
jgi:hypothetical protein